jgi:hypothetical protein
VVDLLQLAAILALIILLLRRRWDLGLVLLLAAAATGLLFGLVGSGVQDPANVAWDLTRAAAGAAVAPLTLRLVAIVLLITFLGEMLRSTLQMEGLIHSLGNLFADARWLLALMPMLIGMLPMVGGAMFSAPMVGEASRDLDVSRERRTFLNYWFRHALEPVFPLYPSLVLAAGLMGVSVQALTVTQWPLFAAALAGGLLFGLVGIHRALAPEGGRPDGKDTLLLLGRSIWPILMVLALSILAGLDLILALVATVLALIVVHRLGPAQLWSLARKTPIGTVPIIIGAMVFRQVLETSHAVEAISASLSGFGIPLAIIVFTVPLIAGLLTGLLVAALAIGLPIVLPLAGPDAVANGYGLLAYAGGFTGMMLSPMHLCLSLTRVYFKAEWGGIYQRLVPAVSFLALTAGVILLVR